jgi:hypothetical protein
MIRFVAIQPDRKMKVRVKDLNLASSEVNNDGIELEIREPDGKHTGDLIITPTRLIWNKGKTSKNGKSINWSEFFKLVSQHHSTSFPIPTNNQKAA